MENKWGFISFLKIAAAILVTVVLVSFYNYFSGYSNQKMENVRPGFNLASNTGFELGYGYYNKDGVLEVKSENGKIHKQMMKLVDYRNMDVNVSSFPLYKIDAVDYYAVPCDVYHYSTDASHCAYYEFVFEGERVILVEKTRYNEFLAYTRKVIEDNERQGSQ